MTEQLLAEGTARDLVNRIQNVRKEQNFQVTDRIVVTLEKHPAILDAVAQFADYIKAEVLAESIILEEQLEADKVELNDQVSLGILVSLN
jgi:isoleucyl-tRNA synthetase